MYRRPGYGGRSKTDPATVCQKCLQRGHYSYECKATAQERPYKSRPSRTQQLLNPQLKPKLTTEVPNDLLRKKGVADEILAKKEQERGRKNGRNSPVGRSRSASYDSVSTISTNRSPSRSPPPRRIDNEKPALRDDEMLGKRRRGSLSSSSDRSPERAERHTRRRMSSFSPERRGRRRARSKSSRMDISHDRDPDRTMRAHRPRSRGARRDIGRRSPSLDRMDTTEDHDGPTSGIDRESPVPRRKWESSPKQRRRSPSNPRSRSPYRRSPSPYSRRRRQRSPGSYAKPHNGLDRDGANNHKRQGNFGRQHAPPPTRQAPAAEPLPPRERSLSPYSKRIALTRQIQSGH
ncbi:unnamed protein product [Periconia digitata]|uniref:Zinc knuckle-domain-containing protein n=1 Tax=Periconia digitata TaxID=1303443 RepID=A0A9W4UP59_9PLEO|nr:unnamed protein product [Periconia digitata]